METQIGTLEGGGGGKRFKFPVAFDVSACDAIPAADATNGVVSFDATVTLDSSGASTTASATVNMLCKP